MSASPTLPNQYTTSEVLNGLREDDVRRKGTQTGSVRRRGDAWYISFHEWRADKKGNIKWRPTEKKIDGDFGNSERGRRKAEQAGYEQWVAKANAQCKVPQGLATVEQFYDTRFVPDHVSMLKKSGRLHYRTMWTNHIKPTIGPAQLREVTPQMVQGLISAKVQADYSVQTVVHVRNCISAIFRHARNLRFYEGQLPTEGVRLPEMVRAERLALTWEQVKMLSEAMPQRYRPLIIFLAQTGLRIGEACGLRWRHANLGDEWRIVDGEALPPNSLLVCSNWTRNERTTTKTNTWRKVPLTAESWVALMEQYEASNFKGDDQPVFASRAGTPMDAHNVAARHLKAAGKKIGIPWISWHCLRHSAATMADKAGLSVAEKMKILGHRTAEMSLHYTHPQMESVRQRLDETNTTGRVN